MIDDLLARSRTPGRFVERRAFTLSRDKAIEKQREFALRHPEQYVLELVQAAVFAGASYVAIDTRPNALLLAWVGGQPFVARDLEHLFDYLFADRADPRWRHVVQLAVGVNAILQRRPRAIRIESGDGATAVRVDLDARGRAVLGIPHERIVGTYVLVTYGGGWLARFNGSTFATEQALVDERCLYAPVPIQVNGSLLFGSRGTRHIEIFGARLQEHFDDGVRRGVVALHPGERAPTGFRIVVGGVWVTTLPLHAIADRPLVGVVCDDRLRKTADQSDIVEDERYVEMLHAVQPVATRLLNRALGGRYQPPPLPPLPAPAEKGEGTVPDPASPEPVPATIPAAWPRAAETREGLDRGTESPVFWIDDDQRTEIAGRELEPDRFPWRVLVLTAGQAATLARVLPGVALYRLGARADVDFVRRAMERRMRMREARAAGPGFVVVLRLHLDGPLPAWGGGHTGVPYCVAGADGTVETGAIDGRDVRITSIRHAVASRERHLRSTFVAPRCSLLVWRDDDGGLEDRHVELAGAHAHALVGECTEDVERELLAELLGSFAVPQLAPGSPGPRVEVSLPVGWPERLANLPLIETRTGPLALADLVHMLGTAEVHEVASHTEVARMDALERRLGYGHLRHASLDGGPVFGAGRVGVRWIWLHLPMIWTIGELTAVVWVGPAYRSETDPLPAPGHDADWRVTPGPRAGILQASRGSSTDGVDWEEGYRTLFEGLRRVESVQQWSAWARGSITAGRAEGRGRLALIQLASVLDRRDVPLLVPTDGGGRRSLDEIRDHRAARVVARAGIRIAEPWTFALTRDELEALSAGPVALRFSDAPEVWRELPVAERGWLVRQEVTDAGLRGWLGLRSPYDPTAGILLRTTGQLVALSDLERAVPCHGLLWTADGRPAIGLEQRRTAQLAGLRLYQSLARLMTGSLAPDQLADARRYATAFVLLAWRRAGRRLHGTALALARLVEVMDDTGAVWGTLERWLATPDAARPALPESSVTDEEVDPVPADGGRHDIQVRLADALGDPPIAVALLPIEDEPYRAPVLLDATRSHGSRATVLLNVAHPFVRNALAEGGAPREALLLELARQVCAWGVSAGFDLDLLRAQQVLLGQRLG